MNELLTQWADYWQLAIQALSGAGCTDFTNKGKWRISCVAELMYNERRTY
jgi:hypothetical protein